MIGRVGPIVLGHRPQVVHFSNPRLSFSTEYEKWFQQGTCGQSYHCSKEKLVFNYLIFAHMPQLGLFLTKVYHSLILI